MKYFSVIRKCEITNKAVLRNGCNKVVLCGDCNEAMFCDNSNKTSVV